MAFKISLEFPTFSLEITRLLLFGVLHKNMSKPDQRKRLCYPMVYLLSSIIDCSGCLDLHSCSMRTIVSYAKFEIISMGTMLVNKRKEEEDTNLQWSIHMHSPQASHRCLTKNFFTRTGTAGLSIRNFTINTVAIVCENNSDSYDLWPAATGWFRLLMLI